MEVFHGCGAFLACPDDPITRGDFFGMVAGVVDFAPGPNAFDDDTHWAGSAIDALSAGGVIRGCADRLVCPDEPITRAEQPDCWLPPWICRLVTRPSSGT